jgi:putative membrane protein
MIRNAFLSLIALGLMVASSACKSETAPPAQAPQTTAGTTGSTTPGTTSGAMGAGMTSSSSSVGDTFGALRAIHSAEIEHGMLAQSKATDPRVRAFAEKVVNDHKVRMKKDEGLMTGLGVTPKDTAVSQQIKSAADQETARLNGLSGTDFDRAYIEGQVTYYRKVLDTFDKDLLPNIRDAQIRADVAEARARANEHLKEAQDLRNSLINR